MKESILKYGDFLLLFGELNSFHFELNPIWCEYYEPSDIKGVGVPKEWIDINLFEKLDTTDDRVYFSSPKIADYSKITFICISCNIIIQNKYIPGYVYIVEGEINSISIFINNEVIGLYSYDDLFEDNIESLKEISKAFQVKTKGITSFKYELKENTKKIVPVEGVFILSTNDDQ